MKQLARITGFAALAALVLVGCGDSSSSSPTPFSSANENLSSSSEGNADAGSSLPPTSSSSVLAMVDNKTIVGLAQKGPFVAGAGVKLWELDDETMARTDRVFTGTVSGGKGNFSVYGVTLASPYALLEVNGRYINEVRGVESDNVISLNALVDLTGRGCANVNMLTHLEYGRALYLVSTGMNVAEAKRQAEREIFAEFGIAGDFADSEELDIFSTDDGGVALLAISVLMQGDLSEAELPRRLADFAADIEEDGEWNDDSAKSRMADWASAVDLKAISDRSSVPSNFVPIVRNFWWNRFGLGACSAQNKSEIKRNADSLSVLYGDYFLCGEVARNEFSWRLAAAIEYDTYQWAPDDDGTIRKGDVTDSLYKYDSLQGKWLDVDRLDTVLGLGVCTRKREADVGRGSDNNVYVCTNSQWQGASGLDYVRFENTCSHDAELVVGAATDTNRYVCDADTFRVATALEINVNRGCTGYNRNEEMSVAGYAGHVVCSFSGKWTHVVAGTITYGGRTYKTIGIGSQTWMAENLNYDYKVNGKTYGNWCYGNSADSCAKYGRLYTWAAAMDTAMTDCGYHKVCAAWVGRVKGVCPDGWHLPSRAEWDTLFTAVGGDSTAGAVLKSSSGWFGQKGNGIDAYGFSALPSGMAGVSGDYFEYVREQAYFWTTGDAGYYARYMVLSYNRSNVSSNTRDKRYGYAVRCVKD